MPKPQSSSKQEELSSALSAFQLTESELAVYQATLELGSRPASQIAKHAGLNRPYTYDVLSGLAEKGLVVQVQRNSVKQFCCASPEELVDLVNRREIELSRQREQLVRALPMLKQIPRFASSQPGFRYFRGVDGIKQMIDHTLAVPHSTIYSFVRTAYCGAKLERDWPAYTKEFNRRRKQQGIFYRGIAASVPASSGTSAGSSGLPEPETTSVRVTTDQLELPLEAFIYGANVAILPEGEEYLGLVIENEAMAKATKGIHDLFWNML